MFLNHLIRLLLIEITLFSIEEALSYNSDSGEELYRYDINYPEHVKTSLYHVLDKKELQLVELNNIKRKILPSHECLVFFDGIGLNSKRICKCPLIYFMGELTSENFKDQLVCDPSSDESRWAPFPVWEPYPQLEAMRPFLGEIITGHQESEYSIRIISYLNATTQMGQGIFIKAKLLAGITNCKLNSYHVADCFYSTQGGLLCDVAVLATLDGLEIKDLECKPINLRYFAPNHTYKVYFTGEDPTTQKNYDCKAVFSSVLRGSWNDTLDEFYCNPKMEEEVIDE